jgi:hypothetical protein
MAANPSDQLDSVQTAISKIELGGQDVTYDGKRVTRADLKTLYEREAVLKRTIDRESTGGIRVRRGTPE